MAEVLDIGEVCSRTGLTASTLRYYEDLRLIESVERRGLRRQYRLGVIDRLATIIVCRDAGFSLAEIGDLLVTGGGPEWKRLVTRKRDETRRQIETLERIADSLDHALDCPCDHVMDCHHYRGILAQALAARTQ